MTAPVNTSVGGSAGDDFGANSWLVEEMYERYRDNPAAVSEQWQEFFSDTVGHTVGCKAGRTVGDKVNYTNAARTSARPRRVDTIG